MANEPEPQQAGPPPKQIVCEVGVILRNIGLKINYHFLKSDARKFQQELATSLEPEKTIAGFLTNGLSASVVFGAVPKDGAPGTGIMLPR